MTTPAYSVTVDGTERECRLESLQINESINRVPVLSADFVSHDASFRPEIDQEIIIEEGLGSPSDRIFGGIIEFAEESAFGGAALDDIVTTVNAVGFASYADRRYVNMTLPAGTLKSQLTLLVSTYLSVYGVTLDPSQVDGPSMAETAISYRKLTDVLNDLSSLTNGAGGSPQQDLYLWEIDHYKVLRMYQAGSQAAPVDLIEGDGTEVGDLVVKPTRQNYANRVILKYGGGGVATDDDHDEQDDHGLWETLVETSANLSADIASRAVNGLLRQVAFAQKEARYNTVALGLKPGQTQTITSAKRNVNGSFLITEVVTRQEPNNVGLIRSITAIEGFRLQGSWQDTLSRMANGTGGVGVIGSGGGGSASGGAGGFAVPGENDQIIYNKDGAAGADPRFTWDDDIGQMAITNGLNPNYQPFALRSGDVSGDEYAIFGLHQTSAQFQELLFGVERRAGGYVARTDAPAEFYVDGGGFGIFATFNETPGSAWSGSDWSNLFVHAGGASIANDGGNAVFVVEGGGLVLHWTPTSSFNFGVSDSLTGDRSLGVQLGDTSRTIRFDGVGSPVTFT